MVVKNETPLQLHMHTSDILACHNRIKAATQKQIIKHDLRNMIDTLYKSQDNVLLSYNASLSFDLE